MTPVFPSTAKFTLRFGILAVLLLSLASWGTQAASAETVNIGYLFWSEPRDALSLLDIPAENDGLAGAELAIDDNNTTGDFTGQAFELDIRKAVDPAEIEAALAGFAEDGVALVATDLPASLVLPAADRAASAGITLFNVAAPDDRLRQEDCRANLIHVAPSRAMLADGLAQYLVWKKWTRWFLIAGSHQADEEFAEAIRRAASRFGAKIVEERVYEDTGGARRTDSGHVQVQRQMPVFTQGAADHDVVIVADESEVFGAYVPYRLWQPRPVAGSAGLVPTSWSGAHEQWGAIQLQNRFRDRFFRTMTARDIQAWTAIRMVGEAATRAGSTDARAITDYLLSPEMEVAAFKGQKLTLRDWNLQLRQPILLADGKTVISASPQEGFLHPGSTLDTLGYDRPESRCRLGG